MNSEQIKEWFGKENLSVKETDFIKFTDFKELREWDVSGRDDCSYIYLGKVDGRFFYYYCYNDKVWRNDWGFMDELENKE